MLDNALGEYDVETKLGGIEFLPIPEDTSNLLPFSELPQVVDNYKQQKQLNIQITDNLDLSN